MKRVEAINPIMSGSGPGDPVTGKISIRTDGGGICTEIYQIAGSCSEQIQSDHICSSQWWQRESVSLTMQPN